MKEICGKGPVFAIRMREVRRGVRLVRALVFRKPYVAIDTHHRAAIGTRIGDESAADLFERRREVRDQTQERRLDVGLVALLVRLEPPALVVSLEVPDKALQDLARNNRSLSWFAETSALPPLCSFQVSLQGISGVAQVLLAHHAHEGTKDFEQAPGRHLQLVIDARAIPICGKDKPVSSSKYFE